MTAHACPGQTGAGVYSPANICIPTAGVFPPRHEAHRKTIGISLATADLLTMTGLRLCWLIAFLSLSLPRLAAAEATQWRSCFEQAGTYYRISPDLLEAIARTESSLDPLALNTSNRNGSWDIGLMQVNSRHLSTLLSWGITADQLYDPCTSIWVGAWILAGNITRYGYTWRAVGAYNAGYGNRPTDEERRNEYAGRIIRQLDRHPARLGPAGRLRP